VKKYGTSEGAIAAWDTRGRGRKSTPEILDESHASRDNGSTRYNQNKSTASDPESLREETIKPPQKTIWDAYNEDIIDFVQFNKLEKLGKKQNDPFDPEDLKKLLNVANEKVPKNASKSFDINDIPDNILNETLHDDEVVALRFSNDIKRDFKRGYSYGEWGLTPYKTKEEYIEDGWPKDKMVYSNELKGYLPAEKGLASLSAEWNKTFGSALKTALNNAMHAEGFVEANTPLYVFKAKQVGIDPTGYPLIKPIKGSKPIRIKVPSNW
jgi:hypothetical protein